MKRVMVLANNLAQASFRLRVAALIPLLTERGFDLDVKLRPKGAFAAAKLRCILRRTGEYHAVLLQRKFLESGEARLLRRSARRILYDVDDAVMYHNRPVGPLTRWQTRRRFLATAGILDHVIAGNEYLGELFRQRGCRVSILPTVVDVGHYQVKKHDATQTPRLVWIGSHSTISYVQKYLPALEEAARQVPGLRLLTIANATVKSDVLPVEHVEWSEQTEAAALRRGDIGIAPTPLDPWTMGKCGFKIVQYMAAGLPVIASPVGANAEMVQDGSSGFLPARPEEWPQTIARLAGNVTLRESMGNAGREIAEKSFNLTRAADDWARYLEE